MQVLAAGVYWGNPFTDVPELGSQVRYLRPSYKLRCLSASLSFSAVCLSLLSVARLSLLSVLAALLLCAFLCSLSDGSCAALDQSVGLNYAIVFSLSVSLSLSDYVCVCVWQVIVTYDAAAPAGTEERLTKVSSLSLPLFLSLFLSL